MDKRQYPTVLQTEKHEKIQNAKEENHSTIIYYVT